MKITLSPMRMDAALSLSRDNGILIINDVPLNLATYQSGESGWIIGQPVQVDGVWQVAVLFPHGPRAAKNLLFPRPITARKNGPIKTPSPRRPRQKLVDGF